MSVERCAHAPFGKKDRAGFEANATLHPRRGEGRGRRRWRRRSTIVGQHLARGRDRPNDDTGQSRRRGRTVGENAPLPMIGVRSGRAENGGDQRHRKGRGRRSRAGRRADQARSASLGGFLQLREKMTWIIPLSVISLVISGKKLIPFSSRSLSESLRSRRRTLRPDSVPVRPTTSPKIRVISREPDREGVVTLSGLP